jgi:hypothetical protein
MCCQLYQNSIKKYKRANKRLFALLEFMNLFCENYLIGLDSSIIVRPCCEDTATTAVVNKLRQKNYRTELGLLPVASSPDAFVHRRTGSSLRCLTI